MPLPLSVQRRELHKRQIEVTGYERVDGLYDVEARMVDTKTESLVIGGSKTVPAGEAIHDMAVRVVIDDGMNILDVVGCLDAAPHDICPGAARTLDCIKGLRIGPGWSKGVAEFLSGSKGCTHLTELLKPIATVAFQTLKKARESKPIPVHSNGRPRKIDSCYAYDRHREVVLRRWPSFHASSD